jgi:precorrin-8X/cobalt-precorrin-8 methylmutase
MRPADILAESFRIIDAEVGEHSFTDLEWPLVRRIIHACGDLEVAHLVHFRGEAVHEGIQALHEKVPIITDVRMVASGINRQSLATLGIQIHCFIDDPDVATRAQQTGQTRSFCAMDKAIAQVREAIHVIGNAPTALAALGRAIRGGAVKSRLLVAMPVGFVSVVESKEEALSLGVPCIAVRGRKGGSAMAAATVNALLLMAIEGARR